jgi:prepilin-type processing-associated H-X9-DG protein
MAMPGFRAARQQSQSVRCLSNLRQMAQALQVYVASHRGFYPPSQYTVSRPGVVMDVKWDFTRVVRDGSAIHEPGLLWGGGTGGLAVQQCPTFDGRSVGYAGEPFTGYNYNTSYLGGEPAGTGRPTPARASRVRRPSQTVVFGDGQYAAGANKFMRSPFPSPSELAANSFFVHGGRYAGTQGFRHRGHTSNAAFADGHAAPLARRHALTVGPDLALVAAGTGFLSADNSAYDLD